MSYDFLGIGVMSNIKHKIQQEQILDVTSSMRGYNQKAAVNMWDDYSVIRNFRITELPSNPRKFSYFQNGNN